MEGSATFTIVASSTTMNWAMQTSTSTSQRFGSGLTTYLSSPDDDGVSARYRSSACTQSGPHSLSTRACSVKPSFAITLRDATFASVVIETTRANPSSSHTQATDAR